MHHPLCHRILCALAAVCLALSAPPGAADAAGPDSGLAVAPLAGGGSPAATAAVTSVEASLPMGHAPCPPGPCPAMPLTTCMGGGCVSAAPLPSLAGTVSWSTVRDLVAADAPTRLPAPASRRPTPPPRG